MTKDELIQKIKNKENLKGLDLAGIDLSWANLEGADLSHAYLKGADLSGANLRNANLVEACLSRANLYNADLRGANLTNANLTGANLSMARIEIISFQADGGHFSYFWNGKIKIGCYLKTPQDWIENANIIAEKNNYSESQKQKYLLFVYMCKEILDKQELKECG